MQYHIQGVIIYTGAGLQDVSVTLGGDLDINQDTGAGGGYSFAEIPNGQYRVTPVKAGYVFEPEFRDVIIENASALSANFTAVSE